MACLLLGLCVMDAYLGWVLAEALTGVRSPHRQCSGNISEGTESVHLGAWCGGRASFANCRLASGGEAGDWLACLAALKESAAAEYDRVAGELRLHASPSDQIDSAVDASSDEWSHFEQLSDLARRHNFFVCRAPAVSGEPRDLFELAQDNMARGLVRETFSSVVALYQSHHLGPTALGQVFQLVARSAAKRLHFSLELHQWLVGQLSPARCRALSSLRCQAVEQLTAEVQILSPDIRGFFGLPSVEQALAILRHLAQADLHPRAWDLPPRARRASRSAARMKVCG